MIFNFIFDIILKFLLSVFSILPSLPEMPEEIVTAVQWGLDLIAGTVSLFNQIFSPPLFIAMITVSFGLIIFENVYHLVMWIVKKIPMLAIR